MTIDKNKEDEIRKIYRNLIRVEEPTEKEADLIDEILNLGITDKDIEKILNEEDDNLYKELGLG